MKDENEIKIEENSEDVVFEDLEDKNSANLIKKLRDKLKKTESEKQQNMDALQRTKADFINLRKRDEQEKQEFAKFAVENFAKEIIPVLDSLDSAIAKATQMKDEQWREGVVSIRSQLMSVLENHGVKAIDPLNELFDPKYHEALGIINTQKDEEDHMILEVFQVGYTLHDRVVRPAKVRIGQKS